MTNLAQTGKSSRAGGGEPTESSGKKWSIARELADHIDRHFDRHRDTPITVDVTPKEIRAHLERHFDFGEPQTAESVFTETTDMLWRWAEHATNPMHFGLTRPTVDRISVIAEALVGLYDPNLAMWEFSPAAIEIEHHVLRTIGRYLGIDIDSGFANFTSGGQEANHTAVVVALTAHFPEIPQGGLRCLPAQPTVYISAEGHHSFHKVANSTGLGRHALRIVPVSDDLTMDVAALETMMSEDREGGRLPFMIVGTAGTTGAGVVDSLAELHDVATRHGAWFHVDAAWGGAAALSRKLRHTVRGMERSDSVTLDAHKWLSVPVGAGMFFCRHRQAVDRTFSTNAHYVPDLATDGRVYPMYSTMQWSRRFAGLKLFMMLAERGIGGITARLEHQTEIGDYLRSQLVASGWELLNVTPLPVICFTHPLLDSSDRHHAIVRHLLDRQTAWISKITFSTQRVGLRASITNYNTQREDIDVLVYALNEALGSLDSAE